MTDTQKLKIRELRESGISISEIAARTGISLNTVKSHCKRNGIAPLRKQSDREGDCCRNCGKPIESTPGKKKRLFCSRECGLEWWHRHPEMLNRKALYHFTCAQCGREFTAYGNSKRRFCSVMCSSAHRSAEART